MKKVSWGLSVFALLALVAVQLGWTTPSVWAASSSHSLIHVVQWGENLYRIAIRYGTTVEAIANANGIVNPHRIYAGQRLVIPHGHPTPPTQGFWYTVQWGDTLSGIAWRYGRNMWAIANANGIANPNVIYASQRIYIP